MTATAPASTFAPVPLGELAHFVRGVTFDPSQRHSTAEDGRIACFRTSNIQDELSVDDVMFIPPEVVGRDEQMVAEGDLLISSANSWELVGKAVWIPKLDYRATVGGFTSLLRANRERLYPRYLYHWFRASPTQQRVRECSRKTTNISNLSFPLALKLEIPIPFPDDPRRSLAEQKRISAILDKADAIRRRRQEAARLADTLIPSVFYEMFGDPMTNRNGWPVVEMEQLFARSPNYGSMQVPTASPGPDSWLDLRVINIQDGHLDLTDKKYITLEDDMVERHGVLDGDLLLARAIGSPEQLGKCIIARPGQERWAFDSHLMRVRFDRSRALPEFIHAYLTSSGGRHEFLKHTRRSAVQFNINTKEIACVRVALPPIAAQRQFLDVLKQTTHNRTRSGAIATEGDALFNSLVQRAFRGEL